MVAVTPRGTGRPNVARAAVRATAVNVRLCPVLHSIVACGVLAVCLAMHALVAILVAHARAEGVARVVVVREAVIILALPVPIAQICAAVVVAGVAEVLVAVTDTQGAADNVTCSGRAMRRACGVSREQRVGAAGAHETCGATWYARQLGVMVTVVLAVAGDFTVGNASATCTLSSQEVRRRIATDTHQSSTQGPSTLQGTQVPL